MHLKITHVSKSLAPNRASVAAQQRGTKFYGVATSKLIIFTKKKKQSIREALLQLLCVPRAQPHRHSTVCRCPRGLRLQNRPTQHPLCSPGLFAALGAPSFPSTRRLPSSTWFTSAILAPTSVMLCVCFLKIEKCSKRTHMPHTYPQHLANKNTKKKIFPRKHFPKLKLLLALKPQGKWQVSLK